MAERFTEVAVAVLHRQRRFLLQLRDHRSDIVYPGHWACFGGHLEPGETPAAAVRRELQEEIGHCPAGLTAIGCHTSNGIRRHLFAAPLALAPAQLQQREGEAMALVPAAAIRRGRHYAPQLGNWMPIATPHRALLLDWLARRS